MQKKYKGKCRKIRTQASFFFFLWSSYILRTRILENTQKCFSYDWRWQDVWKRCCFPAGADAEIRSVLIFLTFAPWLSLLICYLTSDAKNSVVWGVPNRNSSWSGVTLSLQGNPANSCTRHNIKMRGISGWSTDWENRSADLRQTGPASCWQEVISRLWCNNLSLHFHWVSNRQLLHLDVTSSCSGDGCSCRCTSFAASVSL